jgi:hypothetical protein
VAEGLSKRASAVVLATSGALTRRKPVRPWTPVTTDGGLSRPYAGFDRTPLLDELVWVHRGSLCRRVVLAGALPAHVGQATMNPSRHLRARVATPERRPDPWRRAAHRLCLPWAAARSRGTDARRPHERGAHVSTRASVARRTSARGLRPGAHSCHLERAAAPEPAIVPSPTAVGEGIRG